jgi:hypothetical protein
MPRERLPVFQMPQPVIQLGQQSMQSQEQQQQLVPLLAGQLDLELLI